MGGGLKPNPMYTCDGTLNFEGGWYFVFRFRRNISLKNRQRAAILYNPLFRSP